MVDVTELRIGIYLRYPNSKPFKVSESDFLNKNFWEDINDNIEPIPLTEKWLIDFGFYEEASKDRLSIEAWSPGHPSQRFNIDYKEGKILLISRYQEDNDFLQMRNIKFIHQLQNLYFALTGKELKLK